ncbi:MAG: IS66 family transposase [Actinobacteria bacterium]|nr:IS66 family transposase [Actinomycetota bacterium]
MDRAEAEAIYDSGRERCVEVILELAGAVRRLGERGEQLEERIRRLEEQSRKDSRNSSSPPSQDPPKTRAERRAEARERAKAWAKRPGERKQGAQPGHKGSGRKLLPEDQVDEIIDHYPDACGGCGRGFAEEERRPASRFGRHQVAELPAIAVLFYEHRTHHLRCPGCGKRTAAVLPDGVGDSPFGTDLQAAVVTMTARNRVSRRDMSELAYDLFGLGLSVGAVDAICQRAAAALADPHELLVEKVLGAGAVNVDETGWFTAAEGRTMWTATTPWAAIFRIAEDRHRDRLEELIGKDFKGILGSDRWWAYDHIDPESRQACWEHLKRDFHRHSEGLAEQKEFGTAGLELTKRLFKTWRSFQEHQDRPRLISEMAPIQTELRKLLEHAARKSKRTRLHRRFANNLLKIWPALWTFVTVPGVEPTNNSAERALRGPVIHRKLSHGTQSEDGERFIERALSASVTCRLQARSMFAYMRELLSAHARGDPLPSLT